MTRSLQVTPPSRYTVGFLYVLTILFSGFFVYLHLSSSAGLDPEKARTQLMGLLTMLGMLMLAFVGILFALNRRALLLTDKELIVRAGFYGRTLPRSSLRPEAALEVSLLEYRELGPLWRTNGIGLPGFKAGWFRLRNREKALVLLTDPFRVTYLPTSEGYALLVSTSELLPALRQPAPAGGDQASPTSPTSSESP
ncbi:MAG: hypothetical protein IPM02_00440 [Betaproteobacteria bacterium]|nr:hypothetical protein [Betaproteobacteria bacterium]